MNIRLLLSLILSFLSITILAQHERGLLPIQNFTPKDYNALPQNWDIAQSKTGVIYIGNNMGLLEFKGANSKNEKWNIYKVSNGSNVRSVEIDKNGYIFVGARSEFGYFAADTSKLGKLTYYNLSSDLDSSLELGDIWHLKCVDNGVYFSDFYKLFFWDYKTLKQIVIDKTIYELFVFNKHPYAAIKDYGIVRLDKSKIINLKGSKSVLKLDKYGNKLANYGNFTIYDKNSGLLISGDHEFIRIWIYNDSLRIEPFHTNFDKYLLQNELADLVSTKDVFICTFHGGGIIVFNKNGELLRIINKNTGLQNNKVRAAFLDDQNFLWAALNDGVSRIQLFSLYTKFPQNKSGFDGQIESIVRFKNHIYIAASNGLYKLDREIESLKNINENSNFSNFEFSTFSRINHELLPLNSEIWDIKVFKAYNKEFLLACTNNDIVQIDEKGNISSILSDGPWFIHVDKTDSARIYAGLYKRGIGSMYFNGNKWIIEGIIGDINEDGLNIDQDKNGSVWLGTNNGVYRIKTPVFDNHEIQSPEIDYFFNEKHGLDENDATYVKNFKNNLFVSSSLGILKFNEKKSRFEHIQNMDDWFKSGKHLVHRMAVDENNNLWTVVFSEDDKYTYLSYTSQKENGQYETKKLIVDESEIIQAIYPDKNGIIWIGGTNGLFRIDSKKLKKDSLPFRTYINNVITKIDTIYFGLNYNDEGIVVETQPEHLIPKVDYSNNTFEFIVSSIGYNNEVPLEYSFYLEGNDDDWTVWEQKNIRRYTNLREGNYKLRVRSKDIFGNISKEAVYSFTVSPPWYRTTYAYIGYALILILIIWIAIIISTARLKAKNIRLEEIIAERTKEIRKQKDEIEQQRDTLDEQKQQIEDSINYAQRIQMAVMPTTEYANEVLDEYFILFKPKDIVSGDFYWLTEIDNYVIITAADCTGHGVPGAFMSMLGISFLNEIVRKDKTTKASQILDRLREQIIIALGQKGYLNEQKDGMDMSLSIIDKSKNKIQFAGANNPLIIISDNLELEENNKIKKISASGLNLFEVKADKMPVAYYEHMNEFSNYEIQLNKGDRIYMFSDGYVDQFGGVDEKARESGGKKFKSKPFKNLLIEISSLPMSEQKQRLESTFINWKGEIDQLDDVCVIGVKL